MAPVNALCRDMSTAEIIKELRALKARINTLEEKLSQKDQQIKELEAKLTEREELVAAPKEEKWTDRIQLSGTVEVEFGNEHHDLRDPGNNFRAEKTQSHDITLATVELGVDAQINKYTQGHVLFKYEEDDTDPINVDEGAITLGGIEETYGLYLTGGLYYPHFGELNSFLVSDPLTCELFEIAQSAVEVGYEGEWFSAAAGVFHGDVQEQWNEEARINGFFADANFHNPEETLGGLSLLLGASYLSNVADSNTLQDQVNDVVNPVTGAAADGVRNDLRDYVDGFAFYLVAEYGQFGFGAEYITALDEFQAGEMAYAVDRNGVARRTEPAAWNLEFAFRPIEPLQLALKYEGTNEMFGLFPEKQYGLAASYGLCKYTTLSAEYLHGEYDENNQDPANNNWIHDEVDIFTMQLAVEF